MGNLQQEHGFKTDDVPGGLGIAQWLGARRDRLLAKPDAHTIQGQLAYIIEEFNTTEGAAYRGVKATDNVESATIAFQNLYERCGLCVQSSRIQYAYDILGRH